MLYAFNYCDFSAADALAMYTRLSGTTPPGSGVEPPFPFPHVLIVLFQLSDMSVITGCPRDQQEGFL